MSAGLVDIKADRYEDAGCEPMVLFWYVGAGEPVVEGQDLCEIESAKAVVVVTAPASGTLEEVLVPEGEPVASEQVLGRIRAG
jgi:2-oxoglutarate dehydrogenase E2 component (dihydrolipoamide succinyltransferase)